MAVETVEVRLDETWKVLSTDNTAAVSCQVTSFRDALFYISDTAPAAGAFVGQRIRSIPPTIFGTAKVYARAVEGETKVTVERTVNAGNAAAASVLQPLTLSASTLQTTTPSGTVIGAIQNRLSGSTVSLLTSRRRLAISSDGASMLVGLQPAAPGKFTATIREEHPDAGVRDTTVELTATAPALTMTGTPTAAVEGQDYSWRPSVSGGYGTRAFRMAGSLPTGWSMSSTTGTIFAPGAFVRSSMSPVSIGTISVSDEAGTSASLSGLSVAVTGGASPGLITLTKPVRFWGTSLTDGIAVPTGENRLVQEVVTAGASNPSLLTELGQPAMIMSVIVTGPSPAGRTNYQSMLGMGRDGSGNPNANDPTLLDGTVFLEGGRNDVSNGTVPDMPGTVVGEHIKARDALLARPTPNTDFYPVTTPNGTTATAETKYTAPWARIVRTNRRLKKVFGAKVYDLRKRLLEGDPTATADIAADQVPQSLRVLNDQHLNGAANGIWGGDILSIEAAKYGGAPYIMPGQEIYLSGSAAAAAQLNNGAVGTVGVEGTATSFSLSSADFKISNSGVITRASGTVITAPFTDLTVTATNAQGSNTTKVRVCIGAAGTQPVGMTLDGNAFLASGQALYKADGSQMVSSQKMSIVLICKPAADLSTQRFVWGTVSGKTTLYLGATNKLTLVARTTANAVVVNITETAGQPVANGLVAHFITVDLVAGTAVMYKDDVSNATVTAVTTGGVMDLSVGFLLFGNGADNTGWAGDSKMLWMAADAIDFSVQANRDKFWNATTKVIPTIAADGTVNSIRPLIYLRGNAADFASGADAGSASDWAPWVPTATAAVSLAEV